MKANYNGYEKQVYVPGKYNPKDNPVQRWLNRDKTKEVVKEEPLKIKVEHPKPRRPLSDDSYTVISVDLLADPGIKFILESIFKIRSYRQCEYIVIDQNRDNYPTKDDFRFKLNHSIVRMTYKEQISTLKSLKSDNNSLILHILRKILTT